MVAAILCLAADPVLAQTGGLLGERYTPFGSPLADTQSTQTSSQSFSNNLNQTQPGTRIDAVEVNSAQSDAAADDADNQSRTATTTTGNRNRATTTSTTADQTNTPPRRPAPLSEFERYVERSLGRRLPRFGADLLVPVSRDFATPPTTAVPASYIINAGDEITIAQTGSIEGTVNVTVNTDGRIFLPRVGPVQIAGTRYGDLPALIRTAIGRQYRDFRVSVSIRRLRGVRVYVTGFANNPGSYTVNSLSTLVNAVLAAGGPSAGGSFRSIKLYRGSRLISDFDLYDLIRNGDKSKDAILQNEDVLYIPAVGAQIAVAGSVNAEAIYESRPGETLDRLLGYAGGANALADASRVILYRVSNLDRTGGVELSRAETARTPAEGGDIVQVLSVGTLARPLERQAVLVRIEGEVARPGNYYVQPNANLSEVVDLAGGLTSRAFVYGTTFERASVRQQQRTSFEEALRQLEVTLAAAPLTADQSIDAATRTAQVASAQAVLARLRDAQPDGRVVLNLTPEATALPGTLTIENNDRIYVPPRGTTVGVFGAVYRPASFLLEGARARTVRSYIDMAGGPLRAADKGQIFVVRANGSVLSKRNGALGVPVLPGDVIFVPVRTERSSLFAKILQVSTTAFQLGLSAATVVAISR